jgi:hypothetical protein
MKLGIVACTHPHHARYRQPPFARAHADFVLAGFKCQHFRRVPASVSAIHPDFRA